MKNERLKMEKQQLDIEMNKVAREIEEKTVLIKTTIAEKV